MVKAFEYWFDFSCPYAYLASLRVEALAARTGSTLLVRPMLLGGVFRALDVPQNLGGSLPPSKVRAIAEDLSRHAELLGATLIHPAGHPIRTVLALRALLAVGEPFMPLVHAFFRAYWAQGIDLSTREGVERVLVEAGHDAAAVLARAESDAVKQDLRTRTDEAVRRGVFGAPAMFVGDELFFGQDRLDLVEEALGGSPPRYRRPEGAALAPVDFWFDYSSPFTYFASERVDAELGRAARWRPMLLGGLFKMIGTPDVPLFLQSEAKRRHTMRDMERQAARDRIPLTWPTRFPMSTVLALRSTLVARTIDAQKAHAFCHRVFRAYWAEDRDISDASVITALGGEVGLDGAELVKRAPEVKDELRRETEAAAAAGVFGAPTFLVERPGAPPALFWGADRLELAARSAVEGA